jgi:hypothetical protein
MSISLTSAISPPPPNSRQPLHPRRYGPAAITDEASPFALRSTRNSSEDSNAPRRGLAGGATEQLLGKAAGSLAPADGPTAEPSWAPSAAGAVHRNTVGWPSAGPLGVVAQEVRTPPCLRQRVHILGQRPASSVRCGRPVSTRVCPSDRCPVSGAGVRVSGVRCPLWASGVRAFPRPLCPTGARSWRAAVGRQPRAGMAGVGVPPAVSTTTSSEPGSRLRRPRWVRGGVGLDSAVVLGGGDGGGAVASSTAKPTG